MKKTIILILALLPIVLLVVISIAGRILSTYQHIEVARVVFTDEASEEIKRLTALGYGSLPVCMAKTQYSFSDDATKLGAPTGFTVTVRKVKVSAGAGFIVALTGNIMTMPGLPARPAAMNISVSDEGVISGLF